MKRDRDIELVGIVGTILLFFAFLAWSVDNTAKKETAILIGTNSIREVWVTNLVDIIAFDVPSDSTEREATMLRQTMAAARLGWRWRDSGLDWPTTSNGIHQTWTYIYRGVKPK